MAVEAFGSAKLYKAGPDDLSLFGRDSYETGFWAMPLGHDENNPNRGAYYGLAEDSLTKGHALTFGRTRGGKGVSSIIPALLTYGGSMVVIDPKGENAWITAKRRREMGNRVVILDPWGEVNRRYGTKAGEPEPITKFNPLSALDPNDPEFADDITAIAEAFIMQTGNDPHWPDSARELTGGLIAAEVQANPGKGSMRSVRSLIQAPIDVLQAAVTMTMEQFPGSVAANKLASIVETDADGKLVVSKEMSSIRSTARTQTSFLDSVRLLDAMETDEDPFDMSVLAKKRVTLYLVLPVDRLKSHGRWLRMILTLAIRAIAKAEKPPFTPVVFILDELGTISPGSGLSMIEQSYGLMAGLGIRIWAFLQDLPQLQRDYPKSWETFISNSSVIQLLNVADNTTATYFAQYLGNGTINAKTGSWSLKEKPFAQGDSLAQRIVNVTVERLVKFRGYSQDKAREVAEKFAKDKAATPKMPLFGTGNAKDIEEWNQATEQVERAGVSGQSHRVWEEDTQLMSRPVLFPWEIVNADRTTCIIIMPGLYNLQLTRFFYYADPVLSKWARKDPNREQ